MFRDAQLGTVQGVGDQARAQAHAGEALVQVHAGVLGQALVHGRVKVEDALAHAPRGGDDDHHHQVRLQRQHLDGFGFQQTRGTVQERDWRKFRVGFISE